MNETIKCNLYIVGYHGTGKTVLLNRIISNENSFKTNDQVDLKNNLAN